ncbi:aldo/keto reductase [Microbacterium limosum]|uniref:aldo/keto reductase n=1 Tax=Microbacterium limosum TaxID=3079935 RepID=UPI002E7B23DA|nr:aldo/keto reductase [Microbacterium sp. Y20]
MSASRCSHASPARTARRTLDFECARSSSEAEILPTVRELGIGFVPYSPLGRGFLTGAIRSLDQLDESDFRRSNPRFAGDALNANLAIVDKVEAVAGEVGAVGAEVGDRYADMSPLNR